MPFCRHQIRADAALLGGGAGVATRLPAGEGRARRVPQRAELKDAAEKQAASAGAELVPQQCDGSTTTDPIGIGVECRGSATTDPTGIECDGSTTTNPTGVECDDAATTDSIAYSVTDQRSLTLLA